MFCLGFPKSLITPAASCHVCDGGAPRQRFTFAQPREHREQGPPAKPTPPLPTSSTLHMFMEKPNINELLHHLGANGHNQNGI